uniref:ATP-dependent RNA helicase n=1 Tax=Calcidiscus leptoporus TaxID=127549 RepID=A0A7S0NQY3_9EUKA|mmetsp:Transcript_15062/g.34572  ORF Transcript_15062/g.34572 Transcript_15062/m.34572 type:complete len:234 (+) Transcript_15062:252-953(+)
MPHQLRMRAFRAFRALESGVLLCTDVAARGLNLQGVHWTVQYDLPQDPTEYVHRVGRAARLGELGRALLLLQPTEAPFLTLLRDAGMRLDELSFASLQAALCPGGKARDIYLMELALQKQFEARVIAEPFLHSAACAAFTAYIRAYATHAKAVQRLLHVGQLHLGHVAKSFALREPPSILTRQQHKKAVKSKRPTLPKDQGAASNAKRHKSTSRIQKMSSVSSALSEFSAALD